MTIRAMYPGTFDPITNGHIDLIVRASKIFETIIIVIAINPDKIPSFSLQERLDLVEQTVMDMANVEVCSFDGLLVEVARQKGADVIIRGLRVPSDFEHELQWARINRIMQPDVETLFFTPVEQSSYISASLVREIATLGGDVSRFVPQCVVDALKLKLLNS